jgi:uncharacterized Zn finger protein
MTGRWEEIEGSRIGGRIDGDRFVVEPNMSAEGTVSGAAAEEAARISANLAAPSKADVATALMQRIAARCIDQLIRKGYVARRDVEDLRRIEREYRQSREGA